MIRLNDNDAEAKAHFERLKDVLQKRIRKILANGVTYKKKKYKPKGKTKDFLNSLLTEKNLKLLIVARPEALAGIIGSLKKYCPDFTTPATPANIILYNLFVSSCYEKTEVFDKLNFISQINIDTCPYCNRSYIYYLSKKNAIKPEIDHFFPKSKYPFLGVSFYNLIPSCQTCNGIGVKENKDPLRYGLINPYLLNYDDFSFSYEVKSSAIVNSLTDKNSIELKFIKHIPGHLNVFKLKELYDQHKDHVIELIIKSKMGYAESYRKYLADYKEDGLKFHDNEIDRMILGNFTSADEVHKRPLAKLYQDIGRELGLIE